MYYVYEKFHLDSQVSQHGGVSASGFYKATKSFYCVILTNCHVKLLLDWCCMCFFTRDVFVDCYLYVSSYNVYM
jgi:hypothetical protein